MSTPKEVACSFIVAYFETLASKPAELTYMFSHQSSFTVVDFDGGIVEAYGSDIPMALENWARIFEDCQLSVTNFVASPLCSGVNVFVTFSASSGKMEHFFQLSVDLEACIPDDFGIESYFIRNQVASRVGLVFADEPVEEPAAEPEPEALPEPERFVEAAAAAVEAPAATEAPEEPEEPAAPAEPVAPPVKKSSESPSATAPRAAKPKTWASLASTTPSKAEQRPQVKVVAYANGAKVDAVEPAAAKHQEKPKEEKGAATKPFTKAPRPAHPPIGDRLMFNIDYAATDEEIRTGFGTYAANIVSLRNNSASGRVFIDFAANVNALDDLKINPPTFGAQKTRVNIYRQRPRE